VPTAGLSSYARAREVAGILKGWIEKGSFLLTEPVTFLPSADSGLTFKPLNERPIGNHQGSQSGNPNPGAGPVEKEA
jgi:hypothetical protein